jgi:hypothetical protein
VTAHTAVPGLAPRRTLLRRALVPAWALLACALVAAQAPAGVRAPVVIVFLCFVPGMALVGLLNPDSLAIELSLSVALSVALSGLTAGALVYAHLWSPTAVVVVVAAIAVAGGLRDVGLGRLLRGAVPRLVGLPRVLLAGVWSVASAGLPAAVIATADLGGRGAVRLSSGVAAAPRLARRAAVRRRGRAGLVAFLALLRPAGNGVRRVTALRPPRPARPAVPRPRRRPRPERPERPQVAASPLQRFLLDELRQRTGAQSSRRRRPPRSLAHLEPNELADLLSWSSLQRFVTQRAIQELNPELWFVDDLEQRLRLQTRAARGAASAGTAAQAPRGVWVTGVSARKSIPVAWRVLEDDGKQKEWRTRLALEMIDALPEPGLAGAVVAAGTAYGSLSGFRRGLETRGLPFLLRVDPVTAAREVAPDSPSSSAAEAREFLRKIVDSVSAANGDGEDQELVLVEGAEHLLLCEVPVTERASVFWLSNLPAETAPERLASLVRLAHRSRGGRGTPDRLLGTLGVNAEGGTALDRELALLALAGGLRTLDLSAAPANGPVET